MSEKILLLYTGGNGFTRRYGNYWIYGKYSGFSGENCSRIVHESGASSFLITSNWGYNYYLDNDGLRKQIVTSEDIDNINNDDIGNNYADAVRIKTGLHVTLNFLTNTFTSEALDRHPGFDDFLNDTVSLIKALLSNDSTKKIWLSLPQFGYLTGEDSSSGGTFSPLASKYETPYKLLIKQYKSALTELTLNDGTTVNAWNNNVSGIYFAQEIIPNWYTKFNVESPENDYANPICKLIKLLSDEIHDLYNKKFLWIPPETYSELIYEDGNPVIRNLDLNANITANDFGLTYTTNYVLKVGLIANRKDYFDYVIFQPGYYFKGLKNNEKLYQFKYEVQNNEARRTNNNTTGGEKISHTNIGVEMELSNDIHNSLDYLNRYDEYVTEFHSFSSGQLTYRRPLAFYAGTPDSLMDTAGNGQVFDLVKNFYNYGKSILVDESPEYIDECSYNWWRVLSRTYDNFIPSATDGVSDYLKYITNTDNIIVSGRSKPVMYGMHWYPSLTATLVKEDSNIPFGKQEFIFSLPSGENSEMYFGDLNGYNGCVSFIWMNSSVPGTDNLFTVSHQKTTANNLHFTNYMPIVQAGYGVEHPWYKAGNIGTRLMEDNNVCGFCLTLYPASGGYDMYENDVVPVSENENNNVVYYKLVIKSNRNMLCGTSPDDYYMPTADEMIILEGYIKNKFDYDSIDLRTQTSVTARKNDDGSISLYINGVLLERFFPLVNSDLSTVNNMVFAFNVTGAWNSLPEAIIHSFKSYSTGE